MENSCSKWQRFFHSHNIWQTLRYFSNFDIIQKEGCIMSKPNEETRQPLGSRITFRCSDDLKKEVSRNCRKKNISYGRFITDCIRVQLNEPEIDKAAIASCICTLQALINEGIPDKTLKTKAQERMNELWLALT